MAHEFLGLPAVGPQPIAQHQPEQLLELPTRGRQAIVVLGARMVGDRLVDLVGSDPGRLRFLMTTACGSAPLLFDVTSTTVLAHGSSWARYVQSVARATKPEPTRRLLTLNCDSRV
jgi:hypothetical protein